MDSINPQQRLMMPDPLHDQPGPFDPEDLVHLRALLGDTSPRSDLARRLTLQEGDDARQPSTTSVPTRAEKQREKYRNRYRNRIVRASVFGIKVCGHPQASFCWTWTKASSIT